MGVVGGSFSERPRYLRLVGVANDCAPGPMRGWRRMTPTPPYVHFRVASLEALPPGACFNPGFRVFVENLGRVYESSFGEPHEVDGVAFVFSP